KTHTECCSIFLKGEITYLKTKQILHTYHVKPLVIEDITDRLQRIDDGQQLYALKRVQVTNQFANRMEYAYKQAHDKQLRCMLPLYLTETNELFTYANDNYYYLRSEERRVGKEGK